MMGLSFNIHAFVCCLICLTPRATHSGMMKLEQHSQAKITNTHISMSWKGNRFANQSKQVRVCWEQLLKLNYYSNSTYNWVFTARNCLLLSIYIILLELLKGVFLCYNWRKHLQDIQNKSKYRNAVLVADRNCFLGEMEKWKMPKHGWDTLVLPPKKRKKRNQYHQNTDVLSRLVQTQNVPFSIWMRRGGLQCTSNVNTSVSVWDDRSKCTMYFTKRESPWRGRGQGWARFPCETERHRTFPKP